MTTDLEGQVALAGHALALASALEPERHLVTESGLDQRFALKGFDVVLLVVKVDQREL
eukprot:CAMPEP_0168324696 /NCGR_PEP_ID=MMETSP0213-20121227/4242_1 /TAXON_ID=151035 /ORGANISM="Euplotes harpa, Strain FSP1.4" /LENGTH=57 /DNA_ID=CAMNT_0008327031 /DNA_START=147 /DNA_END=316 /DNA_ORIENTATION=+